MYAAYMVTMGLAVVSPGPCMLFAFTAGLNDGYRRGVGAIFGSVLGSLTIVIAASLSLYSLNQFSETMLNAVGLIGCLYLIYLGIRSLWDQFHASTDASEAPNLQHLQQAADYFKHGFLIAITNPKGYLLFLALFPQFISAEQGFWQQVIPMILLFALTEFAAQLAYFLTGKRLRKAFSDSPIVHYIQTASGLVFIALGVAGLYFGI